VIVVSAMMAMTQRVRAREDTLPMNGAAKAPIRGIIIKYAGAFSMKNPFIHEAS
jgi:hypothetical protein